MRFGLGVAENGNPSLRFEGVLEGGRGGSPEGGVSRDLGHHPWHGHLEGTQYTSS